MTLSHTQCLEELDHAIKAREERQRRRRQGNRARRHPERPCAIPPAPLPCVAWLMYVRFG